jgi:hypothetical protein
VLPSIAGSNPSQLANDAHRGNTKTSSPRWRHGAGSGRSETTANRSASSPVSTNRLAPANRSPCDLA